MLREKYARKTLLAGGEQLQVACTTIQSCFVPVSVTFHLHPVSRDLISNSWRKCNKFDGIFFCFFAPRCMFVDCISILVYNAIL